MENKEIHLKRFGIIGFQYACLLFTSVNEKEVEQNLERLIGECDDMELLVLYVSILEFTKERSELLNTIENINTVHWRCPLTEEQLDALTGIAYQRGTIPYDHTPALEKKSRIALEKHPEVAKLFREVFPFIDF